MCLFLFQIQQEREQNVHTDQSHLDALCMCDLHSSLNYKTQTGKKRASQTCFLLKTWMQMSHYCSFGDTLLQNVHSRRQSKVCGCVNHKQHSQPSSVPHTAPQPSLSGTTGRTLPSRLQPEQQRCLQGERSSAENRKRPVALLLINTSVGKCPAPGCPAW